MFSNKGFANYVGVCERGGRFGYDLVEGDSFVGGDMEVGGFWRWEVGRGGEECVRGTGELGQCGEDQRLDIWIFVVDVGVEVGLC